MGALFGPAGNAQSFHDRGYKTNLDIPGYVKSFGLTAYEYQCGRGVKISQESAAKLGAAAGPNLPKLIAAGPALILQEFGNLGTIFLGLPVALLLGMGREGFGATVSICREDTLGLIGERYGMSSPEGMGTMGTYMVGNLFGTIFFGLLASIGLMTGLHPYALAMACGVGSATMMTASSQALAAALPEMSEEILAYAATSNICSSIDGLYMTLFLGIPIANFIYKKMAGKKK